MRLVEAAVDSAVLSLEEMKAVFLDMRRELEGMARRRSGSTDLAADIVQDVFIRWLKVDAIFRNSGEARAYLIRMAANLALDRRKVEHRRIEILAAYQPVASEAVATPEAHALASEKVRQIEAALAELPKHCREILILSRVHGMTHAEIAAQLNVSKSLVEKYAVRALLHCRAHLGSLDVLD